MRAAFVLLLLPGIAGAQELAVARAHAITLADALAAADRIQPQLRQARANTDAAWARADEARSSLLPQLSGTATYQRSTANFTPQPGVVPKQFTGQFASSSFDTSNFWSFNLTLNQLLWDFGQTSGKWRAAQAGAEAFGMTEQATRLAIEMSVRQAYFAARAQKDLVTVARDTLANQDRHLAQTEGFVKVGTQPEIALAQARTDRANALVQLITAQNNYETAKAQLNLAMGVERGTDYDVGDDTLLPVAGEDEPTDALLGEAVRARPDLVSLEKQVRAQEVTLGAAKGGYGPSLGFLTTLSDRGAELDNLAWNWVGQLTLTWPLFQGLLTYSTVKEADANLRATEAQRDQQRLQVRLDVEQARLAVRAAKAALGAADEALVNARERLRLAEGRYQAGVGNIIELGDAQVAFTNAGAQRVQAEYNLASARAQLLRALGRRS